MDDNTSLLNRISQILKPILDLVKSIYDRIIYPLLSFMKSKMIWSISLVGLIFVSLLYFYIYTANPSNITTNFSFFYYITFFVALFFLSNLVFSVNFSDESKKISTASVFANSMRYFVLLAIPFFAFLIFMSLYIPTLHIIKISLKQSLFFTISIVVCILALFYNVAIRKPGESKQSQYLSNVDWVKTLEDIIFYIPCLLIDLVEYFQDDYKETSRTTLVIGAILVSLISLRIVLPRMKFLFKDSNEIVLMEECKELNKKVYFITEKDLKKEIHESNNIVKRNVDNIHTFLRNVDESSDQTSNEEEKSKDAREGRACLSSCMDDSSYTCFKENGQYAGKCIKKLVCFKEDSSNCTDTQPVCRLEDDKDYGYCIPYTGEVKEGFNNIHALDRDIANNMLFTSLTDKEQHILEKLLSKEDNNVNSLMKNLSTEPQRLREILQGYVTQNKYYLSLMNLIYTANDAKDDFIDQQKSMLLAYVNYINNFPSFNYHYSISFWVYLDTSLINNNKSIKKGIIMNYGNKPKMYYNYDTNEIVMEMESMHLSGDISDEKRDITLYRTKNILYQRWNHFVINYNYGHMDIFVNNNLVGTYKNIAPYFDKNNDISFSDEELTLDDCGVCDIRYYKIPIDLSKIESLYVNGKK